MAKQPREIGESGLKQRPRKNLALTAPREARPSTRIRNIKACRWNWEPIENAYIFGEKSPDALDTSMPVFASQAVLAARFGIPLGSVNSYALTHNWAKRREEARETILTIVHQAMLKQAAEAYIPARAAVVALSMNALAKLDASLRGDTSTGIMGVNVADRVLVAAEKVLRNIHAALGIKDPPAVAIQNNIAFVQAPEDMPQVPMLDRDVSQTTPKPTWSRILEARDTEMSPEMLAMVSRYEQPSPPPALAIR